MEKDIKEECEVNNFPSKTRLIYDYNNMVMEMTKDIIINPVEKNKEKKSNIEWAELKTEISNL